MELHSNKMTKGGTGKPMEHGRVRKEQQGKPRGTGNYRNSSIKSKAGFALYSEPSAATKPSKLKFQKVQKTLISSKDAHPQNGKEIDEFLPDSEVVSQIQLQAELMKEKDVKSIVIPAADFESDGDNTGYDNPDYQEFGTPFNMRLVSSTPDPERLLETELLEHQKIQLSMMCPQMIPERDTTHPMKSSAVLTTVASSLSEKLKVQRQTCQQQLLQKQKQHQQPPLSSVQHFGNNFVKHHIIHPCVPNSGLPTELSLPVTKAEWIVDVVGHQDLNKAKMAPTSINSNKRLHEKSSTGLSSSNAHNKLSVGKVSSSDTEGGNKSAQAKTLTIMAQSDMLSSNADNRLHPVNSSEQNTRSSIQPSYSHTFDDNQNKCSFLNHQNMENETISGRTKDYCNTYGKSDESAQGAAGFEKPGKAFSKSDMFASTVNKMDSVSNFLHSTRKTCTESNIMADESTSAKPDCTEWSVRAKSSKRFVINKPSEQDNVSSTLAKTNEKNKTNVKNINGDSGIGNTDSSLKSQIHHNEERRINDTRLSEIDITRLSPVQSKMEVDEYSLSADLDTTSDTCDMEVTILYEQKSNAKNENKEASSELNETIEGTSEENMARRSSTSDAANLSQVIEFLKNDAFNKVKECEVENKRFVDENRMVIVGTDIAAPTTDIAVPTTDILSLTTDIAAPTTDFQIDKKQPNDNKSLAELMQQYLPETDKGNVNNNSIKCGVNDTDNGKEDVNSSCAKPDVEENVNQNHFSDEDHDYYMESSRSQKQLRYLEKMADPTLRDVACRLALKATALRDVELRDLIDDMIFHTDVALGHEDARLQSTQMFFIEENNKLKKRLENINQQLDAKERQERAGTNNFGFSDNDVLHLERKIMYLTQEREKLDNQVTTLLEEKAKWLITQQDLVRTISLKDHDVLKLEEKHHDEMKILHQSLDHATKNSQGVHYKLSAADREISNLEQSIRSRNMEIMNLKEKLADTDGKLMECERHTKLKDQEMLRLQDLVDALKIGVDHVLQAYESSSSKDATTANQRQGIENLRQMVHPEQYSLSSSTLPDKGEIPQAEHRTVPVRGPHHHQETFSSSQKTSVQKENHTKEPFVHHDYHYTTSTRSQPHQRHHSGEDTNFRADHHSQHRPRNYDDRGEPPRRLTSKILEEHNRCLSPVDRTLWRSLDDEPRASRILGEDPYYSDSEIEIVGRRHSSRHYRNIADTRQWHSKMPHFGLSPKPALERTQQHPSGHYSDDWDELKDSQTTQCSTLRSETIPKSFGNHEVSIKDPFSEETYFSNLRSEPLSEKDLVSYQNDQPEVHYTTASHRDDLLLHKRLQADSRKGSSHKHGKDPAEITLTHETYYPRSLSVSHSLTRHSHTNSRNVCQPSLSHDYEQVTGRSIPRHSRNFNDQEAYIARLHPENLSFDTHGISYHHLKTLRHADIEATARKEHHQHSHRNHPHHFEHPLNSKAQPRQEQHRCLSRSVDDAVSYRHPEANSQGIHFRDTPGHMSYSRQSALLNDRSSFPTSSSPAHITDISISRRATRDSENITQKEFFHGTELSASLSSISENNNRLRNLNNDPFTSGIATLDEKIANLQRKIDRTKVMFS